MNDKQIIEQRVNQLGGQIRFLYKLYVLQFKVFGVTPKLRFNPWNPLTYVVILAIIVYGLWVFMVEELVPEFKEFFTYTYSK